MELVITDGGRKEAGFRGRARGDCATRAIAIATGQEYKTVYKKIRKLTKEVILSTMPYIATNELKESYWQNILSPNKGTDSRVIDAMILGYRGGVAWRSTTFTGGHPVYLNRWDVPQKGTFIIQTKNHCTCVIDGKIHDSYHPSPNGEEKIEKAFWKTAEWGKGNIAGPFTETSNQFCNNPMWSSGKNCY